MEPYPKVISPDSSTGISPVPPQELLSEPEHTSSSEFSSPRFHSPPSPSPPTEVTLPAFIKPSLLTPALHAPQIMSPELKDILQDLDPTTAVQGSHPDVYPERMEPTKLTPERLDTPPLTSQAPQTSPRSGMEEEDAGNRRRSCQECSKKRVRCDGRYPICVRCETKNKICVYKQARKRGPRKRGGGLVRTDSMASSSSTSSKRKQVAVMTSSPDPSPTTAAAPNQPVISNLQPTLIPTVQPINAITPMAINPIILNSIPIERTQSAPPNVVMLSPDLVTAAWHAGQAAARTGMAPPTRPQELLNTIPTAPLPLVQPQVQAQPQPTIPAVLLQALVNQPVVKDKDSPDLFRNQTS